MSLLVDPERWARIQAMFHVMLEHPPGERDAALDDECRGDRDLRDQVATLLAAHVRGGLVSTQWGDRMLVVPQTLAGDYEIEREIGKGGMAVVYGARDVKHDRQVAVKVLRPELASAVNAMRFLREIRVTANLQHPNILPLYDSGEVDDLLYYVTPLVMHGSLRRRLDEPGPMNARDVKWVVWCAAKALDYAHRHGVVHRDIKPENILLHEGQAIVADFGIARAIDLAETQQLTMEGLPIGTPSYMSPEQADGSLEVDARTDVYALACVTFECLAGRPPYCGPSAQAVMEAHQRAPVPWVGDFNDDVAEPVAAALTRALAKVPGERFASVADFAAALDAPLKTPHAPPPDAPSGTTSVPVAGPGTPPHEVSISDQEIHFCAAEDGTTIAYATVGTGPPLVKASNWLSHLEFDWQSPVWRHWWQGLARHHRLIRYDQRGCGLSDWDVTAMSLDAWVNDLEAVVDAAGVDRFPLLGLSQGGPIAIEYAVRHPERVTHLVLHGSYARGTSLRGTAAPEEAKMLQEILRVGWGSDNPAFLQVFSTMFYPDASTEQLDWLNELQRVSTSADNAVRLREVFDLLDVRESATRVTVPTLVLHSKDELRIPFEEGRLLASLIPGARLVPLASRNHIRRSR